jgi:hypothetical protein
MYVFVLHLIPLLLMEQRASLKGSQPFHQPLFQWLGHSEYYTQHFCSTENMFVSLLCVPCAPCKNGAQKGIVICVSLSGWTDFDKIWYECYAITFHPKFAPLNLVQSIMATEGTHRFVGKEGHYCNYRNAVTTITLESIVWRARRGVDVAW